MKENIEDEERMYKHLQQAKYGRSSGRRPKVGKKFKEDDEFEEDQDLFENAAKDYGNRFMDDDD
eukprot:CAMPEP_0168322704 /NCGR_PEP_ID=MMETSP0213-20121227/3050_1 /TAXON_ID=151035 /ORGANISM="Euplotes harpa, Strain FSP1.4" /LENGTH=63 /DNA_ID=CAMNT_0008324647 /DNA_START=453 /DNA_END=641 /DNA_ORIENTATION=+